MHYDAVENQPVDVIYNLQKQDKTAENLNGATGLILNYKTGGAWSTNAATILNEATGRMISSLPENILKQGRFECFFEGVDILGKAFKQLHISRFHIRKLNP